MPESLSFIKLAVKIAADGIGLGRGPFGAVVVKQCEIVATASNQVVETHDPTAHAEIQAIRLAARKLGTHDLTGCDIYCSCEPCPMCLGAIYWSGIKNVFYSAGSTDAESAGFSDKFIYNELALDKDLRKVKIIRLEGTGGEAVFQKWNSYEGKVPY